MKRIYYICACVLLVAGMMSCKREFLERQPQGALERADISTPEGINSLLIGAYAALDGQDLGSSQPWSATPSNWIFGSVAGGDAHKGSEAGDQAPINPIANWNVTPSNPMVEDKWLVTYAGIDRANWVLKVLPDVEGLTDEEKMNIEAQAKFLRAHYYFEVKKFYNMVPWMDETTEDLKQKNDQDIWSKIEADFQFAYDNLPQTQADAGRANKWAAGAYLAKTYLYQKKFDQAQQLFEDVISQGQTSAGVKYGLFDQFEDNFRPEKELSSPEAVFVVEEAANVGTGTADNATIGEMLNYPYGDNAFGCCGFYQPTIDLANSYRTDPNGLPYLDDYNSHPVKNDLGLASSVSFTPDAGPLDPRIDWTIGRRGIPVLDWGNHPGQSWVRDQTFSGPYGPMKNIWWQATPQYLDNNTWAPATAINTFIIRFSDVLLMAAEANVQASSPNLSKALGYVNQVRNRAANPAGFVRKYIDDAHPLNGFSNTPAANYQIKPYTSFSSAEYALKAIYFERKLELAMEGQRFFDLSRWGIAAKTMNDFYAYEGAMINDVKDGHFTANKNEYYPIPQTEIDRTLVSGEKTLTQNPGYQ